MKIIQHERLRTVPERKIEVQRRHLKTSLLERNFGYFLINIKMKTVSKLIYSPLKSLAGNIKARDSRDDNTKIIAMIKNNVGEIITEPLQVLHI